MAAAEEGTGQKRASILQQQLVTREKDVRSEIYLSINVMVG